MSSEFFSLNRQTKMFGCSKSTVCPCYWIICITRDICARYVCFVLHKKLGLLLRNSLLNVEKSTMENLNFFVSYEMLYAIMYHLLNLKNVKNTHGGVLLLVTRGNTPSWTFFMFFILHKWYQIAQNITYLFTHVKRFKLL